MTAVAAASRNGKTWKARTGERQLVSMDVGVYQGPRLVARVPLATYSSPAPAGGNARDPRNAEAVARAEAIAALPEAAQALADLLAWSYRHATIGQPVPEVEQARAALAKVEAVLR